MTASVQHRPTVLDATVLSNVAYLDAVSLLTSLDRPVTKPTVQAELTRGTDRYPYLARATEALSKTIPVVELTDETQRLAAQFTDRLDRGEAEALAVADYRHGLIATDDGAARAMARDYAIPFTGTIGILVDLVEDGLVTEQTADSWLKQLVDDIDYYAPSRHLSEYL